MLLYVPTIFFISCIKSDYAPFQAPDDLSQTQTSFVDTFSLSLETYRLDSLNTTSRQYLYAGRYDDGILGSVETQSFFQLLPESYPVQYPDSIIDDSIKGTLFLRYDLQYGKFGFDKFALHRLTSSLRDDRSYFAFHAPTAFESTPFLGSDSAQIERRVLKLKATQLAREIVAKWKEVKKWENDQQFLQFFKGLALRSTDANRNLTRFDLKDSAGFPPAVFQISYRVKEANTPVLKTLNFRANSTTVHYYTVRTDLASSAFASLPAKSGLPASQSGGRSAVQGMTALATKIKVPGFNAWRLQQKKRIKVFKAELEIVPDDPGSLDVPSFIRLNSRKDYFIPIESDAGQRIYNDTRLFSLLQAGYNLAQAQVFSNAQLFEFNTTEKKYKCNISRHIQDLIDQGQSTVHFNIYAADWAVAPNRMLLSPGNLKLKIYYYEL